MGFYCGAAVPVTTVPNNRHSASCKRTVNAGAGAGAKECQLYREKKTYARDLSCENGARRAYVSGGGDMCVNRPGRSENFRQKMCCVGVKRRPTSG